MGLSPGERFGPYDVLGQLGAGGMGVVYRARDARLGREVAIKTLPPAAVSDPVKLQRFEAEARAASALNHPNVLAVFDVGREGDTPYFVTELLEGETLRERLERGPLPVRKAVEVAMEIARGLAAVHDKGIVHRDLKPENVFLTRDGGVKILDFGVARAAESFTPPTGTLPLTQSGAVMGTAGYMSPEQVRGRVADARSDLFSLGAIMYECLTGKMAFPGESPVERGYAILNAEPAAPARELPAPLLKVVQRCLEKDPQQRFQHARDLRFALEATSSDGQPVLTPPRRPPRARAWLPWVVAAASLLGLAAVLASRPRATPTHPQPSARRVSFRNGRIGNARFASDGRSIVYAGAFENSQMRVYSGVLDGSELRPLSSPGHVLFDVSSRDDLLVGEKGRGAATHGKPVVLSRGSLAGGGARPLYEDVMSADEGPDGKVLLSRYSDGAYTIEYPAGRVLVRSDVCLSQARLSPDARYIAFARQPVPGDDRGSVEIIDVEGRSLAQSKQAWTLEGVAWSATGKEVWFSAGFDGIARRIYGLALDGQQRLVYGGPGSIHLYDVDAKGRVLASTGIMRTRMFGKLGADPDERPLSWLDGSMPVDLSADANALLFLEGYGPATLELQTWFRRFDGEDDTPILLGAGRGLALSPDTRWALLSPQAPFNTLRLVPTGPGTPRDLPPGDFKAIGRVSFFPDGKRIVFSALDASNRPHVYVQSVLEQGAELGGAPVQVSEQPLVVTGPPSPDGKWLLTHDPQEHRSSLLASDGSELKPLPSLSAQQVPVQWSPDGSRLWVMSPAAPGKVGLDVSSYELASGRLEHAFDLRPADPMGMEAVKESMLTPDGAHYVFTAHQDLDELYLIEGVE